MTQTHTAPAPTGANQNPAAPSTDDLGIDRAFLLQLAQVPFIATGLVLLAYLSHFIWGAIAGESARNFGPIVVLCAGMILAAVIDGWAFKVPNWLTLSFILSGWILGLLHTCGLTYDLLGDGILGGGIGYSMLYTAFGFLLLFPLLAIIGMGQGDVKMLMGFGAWIGAYFGEPGWLILLMAFCVGAIVGGVFGLVMMACRRKFSKNLSNFKEIFVDLRVMATMGPAAANERANARRKSWDRLPYGIPLCIGFLGYLGYLFL